MTTTKRTPAGVPAGGEFAPTERAEASMTLAGGAGSQAWHTVDSDDRYPGQFISQVAELDGFLLRVDPGNSDTYNAVGFAWSAERGSHRYSGYCDTRDEATQRAIEAADYVTSGQGEYDFYLDNGEI